MGAAVKLIHVAHQVDTAIQAAVTDHVVGNGLAPKLRDLQPVREPDIAAA